MNFINTLDITVINLKKGLSNTLHHKTNSNLQNSRIYNKTAL